MSLRNSVANGGANAKDKLSSSFTPSSSSSSTPQASTEILPPLSSIRTQECELRTSAKKTDLKNWLYRSGKAEDATVQRYGPFLYNSGAAFGGSDYRIERYGSSVPCTSPLSRLSSSLSTRLVLLTYIFRKSETLIEGLEEGAGFCGFMSILSSLRYALGPADDYTNIYFALAFIPFGLFFDFMDGKVARWRGKSSLMGQELDSLADL
ncbi:MAG: hypothetical protein Q9164_004544, partial [Protoblastenia rupestris]